MTDKGCVLDHAGFIWSVADLLRGDYKQSEYGKVVLPLTVLRRLDCVLAPTKPKVLEKDAELEGKSPTRPRSSTASPASSSTTPRRWRWEEETSAGCT